MTDMLVEACNITRYCTENINLLKKNIEFSNSLATILTQTFKGSSEADHSSKMTLYWTFKSLAKENAKKAQEIQRVVNSVLLTRPLEGKEKKLINTLEKIASLSFDFFKKASEVEYHSHYEAGMSRHVAVSLMAVLLGLGVIIHPALVLKFGENSPYWVMGIGIASWTSVIGRELIELHSQNILYKSAKNLSELLAFPVIVPEHCN